MYDHSHHLITASFINSNTLDGGGGSNRFVPSVPRRAAAPCEVGHRIAFSGPRDEIPIGQQS